MPLPPTSPRRVLGYARVSSVEQAAGTSLQDQEDAIRRPAKERGLLRAKGYYVEGIVPWGYRRPTGGRVTMRPGHRVGFLRAVRRIDSNLWLFRCDCGAKVTRYLTNLHRAKHPPTCSRNRPHFA